MSIRIHALAKELNITSKELIEFINERQDKYGLEIKTPSNSVASIYADEIAKDFRNKGQEEKAAESKVEPSKPAPAADANQTQKPEAQSQPAKDAAVATPQEAKPATPQTPKQPEPEAKADQVNAEQANKNAQATPPVSRPAPVVPPAAKPAPAVPPTIKPAPAVPPMQKPPLQSARPASVVPPTSAAPRPAPAIPPMRANTPPRIPMPQVSKPAPAQAPLQSQQKADTQQASKPAPAVPPSIGGSRPAPVIPGFAAGAPRKAPGGIVLPNISVVRRPAPTAAQPAAKQDGKSAEAAQESAANSKTLQIKPPIIVRDFARAINLKPFKLISELMDLGIFASMNQAIEEATAVEIAKRHGITLEIKHRGEQQQQQLAAAAKKREMARQIVEDIKNFVPRPPIVCILGHVDHGKTTLLDTIRNTNVVAGEAGGITQHTAAYQVTAAGKKITFLDTPGHAAFSKMRERGANVTDIAILVVAADDGFMPQTDEALNFAQKAGVPIVVAINKMDAKGANIDRVKQQMQKRGITSEDWGGEVLCQPISALKGENVDKLLELVLLQAEMMELKANPKAPAEGVIIESQLEPGRGATATVIVRSGTLKPGDVIVCGENWCKVRALLDDRGKKIASAEPSTPAIVMGWTGAPESGETFTKVENDRQAKRITEEAMLERKRQAAQEVAHKPSNLEELMAAIENQDQKVFRCIVKSDVSGTVEALVACLNEIKSDKVKLEVVSSGVGQITKNDVDMAATVGASIVAFNVKQENGVAGLAKHKGVAFITHNIIYELINEVREAMKNLLEPELKENKLGAAEVRALFNISKGGKVAGCMVTEGIVKREKRARVFRKGKEIANGKIVDLKRFKDDVNEVRAGYECGISLSNFNDFEPKDIIECYEILEIRQEL